MSKLEMETYEVYCGSVDLGLEQLKAKCLGQLRPIKSLVPIADHVPTALTAELAAEILTILIFNIERPDDSMLWIYQNWLKTAIEFILENCPPEDHTLFSVVKLAKLEHDVLLELLPEELPQDVRSALFHPPEDFSYSLEEAIWQLMEDREKEVCLEYLSTLDL